MSAAEIQRELYSAVYGQNIRSEGTERQLYRMFKDGRTNVHDEEQIGSSSVVSDDHVQSVAQKTCERGPSKFPLNFLKFNALLSTRLSQVG
jgi:hypothetical protein